MANRVTHNVRDCSGASRHSVDSDDPVARVSCCHALDKTGPPFERHSEFLGERLEPPLAGECHNEPGFTLGDLAGEDLTYASTARWCSLKIVSKRASRASSPALSSPAPRRTSSDPG